MRVLHIINDLRIAGAERFVADIAPRQAKADDISVRIATLGLEPTFLSKLVTDAGIPITHPSTPLSFHSPRQIDLLAQAMREVDIVHVQLFPAQLWAAVAAARMGKKAPVLVTTEQNTYNRRRDIPLLRPVDAWMYKRYTRIAAITDATADALIKYLPETRAKTVVIPNGIPLERFQGITITPEDRAKRLPEVPTTAPLLTSIGRLETQKDVPTLLRALAQLDGVHLALIGDGPLRQELEALAKELKITNRAHFLGRREDVAILLRLADLYVQSSAWEGFGIAAVEAMASGLPVVHSDVPGLREVVSESAGVRCRAGDPTALANAIRALLGDTEKRALLGKNAKERAALYRIENSVAAYLQMYRDVL